MDPSPTQEPQTQKSEALKIYSSSIKSPYFPSSISKLSGSSRGIPCNKDFHFYFNFEEFKNPIQEIAKNSQSILETIGSSAEKLWGKKQVYPSDNDDDDEAYDWLVNFNDELFERFDHSVDEFKKIRKKEEETGVRVNDDDGFQLVHGKKKKDLLVNRNHSSSSGDNNLANSSVKVKTMGTPKSKIPFHNPSIPRPQDQYKILVNNSNQPFEHVWLQRSEDGSRFIHPLENYSIMDFIDKSLSDTEPVLPAPVENTPFKLVQEVKDLKELAAKLRAASEFAVDLEHNQYRSFQGLTCLMQISTRTEDFIVDTLKLRIHVGPYLREVFKDPSKRKVMHGADRDIIWLQRDFGIYVCNMFDTGQASKVLKLERNSLEYLLRYFCGVVANKEYQNADWRLRPLINEMLRYAREDTHYLLYIYDLMRKRLLSVSSNPNFPEALVEVYQRSYDVCMQLYQKELLTENSYLNIYGLHAADLNGQQLAIVAGLCEWRDVIARAEDESTGYILPNKVLIEIAKQMPVTAGNLRHLVTSKNNKLPYLERNLGSVLTIVRHSMLNAAAYEPMAKKLKEERIEMEARRRAQEAEEASASSIGIAGAESTSTATESESFEAEVGNFIAGANRNIRLDGSSASRVSVKLQKKPSGAFGAMLGSAPAKRKFDLETKAPAEIKVEQIKSSVSLPFHSFSDPLRLVVKEPTKASESPNLEASSNLLPATTSSSAKPEQDIIMLESDSDAEEERPKPESTAELRAEGDQGQSVEHKIEDENRVILLDSDSNSDGGEPMSLSDLSSSFKECLKTADEKGKAKQEGKSDDSSRGLVQVEPFDYAAARKEVTFGEDGSDGGGKKDKSERGSGSQSTGGGREAGAERSGDFETGRRRQAFPATGNRSATFR